MEKPILAVVAVACVVAAVVWGRSARYLRKVELRLEQETGPDSDATVLARSQFRKELHTAVLYVVVGLASLAVAFSSQGEIDVLFAFVLDPRGDRLVYGRDFIREARLFEGRASDRTAGRGGALPGGAGAAAVGRAARPPTSCRRSPASTSAASTSRAPACWPATSTTSTPSPPTRLAVVIGDVTGHGIEPSITAFQAKELLRVFLGEYRDPAQALEVLNQRMSLHARAEEFVSILVAVFDDDAGTLRYASAGHPAGWLWHDRDVHPLRATGPLLLLDPAAAFYAREVRSGRRRPPPRLHRRPRRGPRRRRRSSARSASARCCAATQGCTPRCCARPSSRRPATSLDPDHRRHRHRGDSPHLLRPALPSRTPWRTSPLPPRAPCEGNLHKEAEKLGPPGQALRARPAGPAARRGIVRRGRPPRQRQRDRGRRRPARRRRRDRHRARRRSPGRAWSPTTRP